MTDYSSGMRVRVGLARALLADPEVLLLDEPTASLDAEAVERFRALVAQRADERGTAVVLATHDLADAAALATHTLVLRRGSVVARRERAQHDELEDLMLSLAR
jgi:ABC-type multidrug transport system ATPase subunit